MAFFARPNLDNTQFKQLQGGEPLTLSGQTQIATASGLTLYGGVTGGTVMNIPVIATGAVNNYVLTYDSYQQAIVLKEPTGSGGTGSYSGREPTTCTVGGLSGNTSIGGWSVDSILECVLTPVVNPTLTDPSISCFTINNTTTVMEVGSSLSVNGMVCSDLGSIDSNFSGITDTRSSGVICNVFNYFGGADVCLGSSLSTVYSSGVGNIVEGNNLPVSVTVHFSGGSQPYNSTGGTYSTPFTASTITESKLITGIYPWFWGVESGGVVPAGDNRPDTTYLKSIITANWSPNGTVCKVVGVPNGTIQMPFNSTAYDYIWFAIPSGTTKTCWSSSNNCGDISGSVNVGGNLFPSPEVVTNVSNSCWCGQTYQIYVSNYQTSISTIMEIN